jgi:hypothetical protein
VNARTSIRYMKWVGEKMKAGDTLTEEEVLMFEEAEDASLFIINRVMRLGPEDWKYTPGEPFK